MPSRQVRTEEAWAIHQPARQSWTEDIRKGASNRREKQRSRRCTATSLRRYRGVRLRRLGDRHSCETLQDDPRQIRRRLQAGQYGAILEAELLPLVTGQHLGTIVRSNEIELPLGEPFQPVQDPLV